jgi:hypothetical protein
MTTSRPTAFLPAAALAALLVLLPATRGADISAAAAARAAKAWVDRGYAMGELPAGRAVAAVDEIEDPATGARLLVAKFDGGGYVVLSADDLVDPVLAFSETGDGIVLDNRNPFWVLLRGDIAAREAAAGIVRGGTARAKRSSVDATSEATAAARAKWAALLADDGAAVAAAQGVSAISDVRVEPFVRSKWSQSTSDNYSGSTNYCYNYYTPNHYVCGCTATAIAQIMRYWRFPTAPVAANSYPCAVAGSSVTKTMKGGVYDWDAMLLDPRNEPGLTEAQRREIGKLCHDVGVTVEMEWDDDGSSSSLYAGVACLPIDFGYANAKAVNYGFGQNYDLEHFKLGVVPNLDARCPVGVSVTGDGGHSVVGDGYGYSDGDFYIHLNMGWAGQDNLWYAPPRLGTTSYAFNAISGYLFNVFPEKTGSIASGRVLDASGAPVADATVALRKNGVTVDTAVTDANGIYAFIAPAGTYLVAASKDGAENSISVTLGTTTGTSITTTAGQRGYYGSGAGTIGNTYGNDIALTGMAAVPAPVFDPGDCLFYPATNVTISCTDPDAVIRYTLDGSAPTETSAVYSGPVFVEDDVTIKARAFAPGKNPSPVVAATYTYDAAQGAPKGDYFANPIKISGANGTRVVEDNSNYTEEDGEPWHTRRPNGGGGYTYNYQYRTIWYQWTAPGTGTMTFRTSCSEDGWIYPTYIAVYTGDTLAGIVRLAYSIDRDSDWVTSLAFDVEQGTTYRIVGMMGCDGCGAFTLSWSGDLVAAASPYETWAEAHGLSGDPAERSNGVENAFRYVFGKPTEPFSPILGISSAPGGGIVLTLPPVANTDGVSLKLLSAAKVEELDTANVTERAIAPAADGTVVLGDRDAKRFYRLGVDVAE